MNKTEIDFEKHIDDIVKAIGDKLERNVIATELRRYVENMELIYQQLKNQL